jgi:hypothetical protein
MRGAGNSEPGNSEQGAARELPQAYAGLTIPDLPAANHQRNRRQTATVSAEALRALCSTAQEAAVSREFSRALDLLPRLEEQFELLKTTLKQSGWV